MMPSRRSTARVNFWSAARADAESATRAAASTRPSMPAILTAIPLFIEYFADLLQQVVARERLGEEVHGKVLVEVAGIAGNAEQLQRAPPRPQLVRELGAAHVGHAHVGQQQVDALA